MTNKRVNEIDLLRFLSAIVVVLFHYGFRGFSADNKTRFVYPFFESFAKYGFWGVHLFFIISGFVITMSASNGGIRNFIISRFVRLFPAFWTCCTITFIATLFIGGSRYSASFKQYLINLTMLSNYFSTLPIDGAYWSLFVELKFYFLIFILLLLRLIKKIEYFLVFWIIATITLEFFPQTRILNLYDILIVNYSAYFIAGAICYQIWKNNISLSRFLVLLSSWVVALYQSIATVNYLRDYYHKTFNNYIAFAIITIFFLIFAQISTKKTGVISKINWSTIGVLTFPLYLLHQNLGYMLFNIFYKAVNPHVLFFSTIVFMLMSAYIVNRFIEVRYAPKLKKILTNIL